MGLVFAGKPPAEHGSALRSAPSLSRSEGEGWGGVELVLLDLWLRGSRRSYKSEIDARLTEAGVLASIPVIQLHHEYLYRYYYW